MQDERTIRVTKALSWVDLVTDPPHCSWSFAQFENKGPSGVAIGINNPGPLFALESGATRLYNEQPIKIVFFRATPGLSATVHVKGEY